MQRNKGRYLPDFAYNKAVILEAQGRKKEAAPLLIEAYFGFIAMRRRRKAAQVLKLAEKLGIKLETYGVENLPADIPEAVFEYGKPIPGKSIGDLIYGLRTDANMKQGELCKGVCSVSVLSRIERDAIQGKVYYLEAFMQRLGRDIDKYFDTFLGRDEFAGKQLRDKVRTLTVNHRYEEAKHHLKELKKHKDYQKGVNLQFIAMEEADIHAGLIGYDEAHMSLLKKAWAITKDDLDTFDEYDIAKTRLTNYEIVILNQKANNMCENEQGSKGIRIYESLLENMEQYYVDESERIRMYMTVLYNYSNELESLGRYAETLESAIKGEGLCIKHFNLRQMPGFMADRACALYEMGEKEKSLPYLVVAYYVSALLNRVGNQRAIHNYIKERFNIDLD